MKTWQAIYDEYPSGRLEFCVLRGEDRSTLEVLSAIEYDDAERLNSNAEFERRMTDARQEAAFRNARDESDEIGVALDPI